MDSTLGMLQGYHYKFQTTFNREMNKQYPYTEKQVLADFTST